MPSSSTLEEGAFPFPPLNTPRDALSFAEFSSFLEGLPSNNSASWSTSPGHRSPGTGTESPTDAFGYDVHEEEVEVTQMDDRSVVMDLDGKKIISCLQTEMERDHLDEDAVLHHLDALNPNQHEAQIVAKILQQLLIKARTSPRILRVWVSLVVQLLESKETFRALFRLDFPLFSGLTQTIGLYHNVEELCCSLLNLLCTLHMAGSASDRQAEIRAFLATLMRVVETHATSTLMLQLFADSVNKILKKFGPDVVKFLVGFGACPLLTKLLSDCVHAKKGADKVVLLLACYLDWLSTAKSASVPIWKLHNISLQTMVLEVWREGLEFEYASYVVVVTNVATHWMKESRLRAFLPVHDVCQLLTANISGFARHSCVLEATLLSIEAYAFLHKSTRPHWEATTFLTLAHRNAEITSICLATCNILRVSLDGAPAALCDDIWHWLCGVLSTSRDASLVSAGLELATDLVGRLNSEESLYDAEMLDGVVLTLRNTDISDVFTRRNTVSLLTRLMEFDAATEPTNTLRNPTRLSLARLAAVQMVIPWIHDCLDDEHMAIYACKLIRLNLNLLSGDVGAARSFVESNDIPLLMVALLSEHTDNLGLCLACCELMLALCAMQREFCVVLVDSGAAELLLRSVKLQQEDVQRLCPLVYDLLEFFKSASGGLNSRIYKHRDYCAFLQVLGIPRSTCTVLRKKAAIVIVEAADLDSIESFNCLSYIDCNMNQMHNHAFSL